MKKIVLILLVFVTTVLQAGDLGAIDNHYKKENISMGNGWATHKYEFQSSQSGQYTIKIDASRKYTRMKAGRSNGAQDFFRDASGQKKVREQTITVVANEKVYLRVWKDDHSDPSKRALNYKIDIQFISDTQPALSQDSLTLSGTLRDFHDYSKHSDKNPDFENSERVPVWNPIHASYQGDYAAVGLVNDTLTQGVPTLKSGGVGHVYNDNGGDLGTIHSITDANSFSEWFQESSNSQSTPYELTLTKKGNVYVYDSEEDPKGYQNAQPQGFFPLDGKLLGDEGRRHNYHFTYHAKSQFTYQGGETFEFSGDDDVWVFINGKLVVDVGGIHGRVVKSINLDQKAQELGIRTGGTYSFDFFFAERHVVGSNLKITTTLKLGKKPFTCNDTMYFSNDSKMGTTEGEDDRKMWLHKINREQTPFRFDAIGDPFNQIKVERSNGVHYNVYNALSYNPADNFLYALVENKLVKIDSTGVVDVLGVVEGLPKCDAHGNYYAGSFGAVEEDEKSYFYITSGMDSEIYKIDVDEQKVVDNFSATEGIYAWDVAADKEGNYLYYIDRESSENNNQLRRVRIRGNDKGKVEAIGSRYKDDGMVDVIFYDANDKIYVLYHDKGFYEVDKETGKRTAISNAPVTANLNDAAMCPNATVDFKPIISIGDAQVIEGDSGTTDLVFPITYSGGSSAGVTFDYATADGTNTNSKVNATSADYIGVQSSGSGDSITVKVKGDKVEESDEQLSLALSNIQGALYHDSSLLATGTIVDNDTKQNAFVCEANSYIFTSHPKADYTKALNVNFMDNKIETLREEFNKQSDANIRGSHINAIGYNVQDNYIYGWEWDAAGCVDWTCSDRDANNYNPGVVKIDKDFNIQRIAIEGFDKKRPLYSGDISLEGKYYISGSAPGGENTVTAADRIYVVDLEKRKLERTLMLSHPVKMADFAFNPMDNKIYTIETWLDASVRHYDLVRIDPADGIAERLGDVRSSDNNISNAYTNVTFFDRSGNFYFYTASDDIKAVFKIDISKPEEPINTNATLYKELTLAQGGDGARCSLAPIENKYELNVTNSSAQEGDSGYNDMNITITLDRAVTEESGLSINYTLTSGSEIIDNTKKHGSFTIPKGESEYKAKLPVIKGDILVEQNKDFTVKLSIDRDTRYTDKDVMSIDGHKVEIKFMANDIQATVIDDDYFTFKTWEDTGNTGGIDIDNQKIHTQIVNGDIKLKIALINKRGNLMTQIFGSSDELNNTKVRVVDVSGATNPCSSSTSQTQNAESSFVAFDMGADTIISYTLPQNQASLMKKARVQFSWQDKSGWKTTCSEDLFAIRPKGYKMDIPSDLIAGKDFTVTLTALDAKGFIITGYNELAKVYTVDINETKSLPACHPKNAISKKVLGDFKDGKATVSVNYNDIGRLRFIAREVKNQDTEYANVDKDDGTGPSRYIDKDVDSSVDIKPAAVKLVTTFESGGGNGYTYYAGLNPDTGVSETSDMAAKLKATVSVLRKGGTNVKNFTKGCYADDVRINVSYTGMGQAALIPEILYTKSEDADHVSLPMNHMDTIMNAPSSSTNSFSFYIKKALFVDGVGMQAAKINFQRKKNDTLNPMKLAIEDVNASVGSLSDDAPMGDETTFIYIKAHVASPQSNIGKEKNVTVNYQVYMDDSVTKSDYGLEGLPESEDEVKWYNIDASLSTGLDYDPTSLKAASGEYSLGNALPISGPHATTKTQLNHASNTAMQIIVPKLPSKNKILYSPTKEYLKYSRFGLGDVNSFRIDFLPDTKQWMGKGDLGMTIDNTSAVGNGLKKMDW